MATPRSMPAPTAHRPSKALCLPVPLRRHTSIRKRSIDVDTQSQRLTGQGEQKDEGQKDEGECHSSANLGRLSSLQLWEVVLAPRLARTHSRFRHEEGQEQANPMLPIASPKRGHQLYFRLHNICSLAVNITASIVVLLTLAL